jgi:DNA-binding MarR family transcriptional regulator
MAKVVREDPDSSIGFLISDVSRLLRRVYDRRVEPLGLTRAQWRVLVHIYRREGISQTALAQVLEIEKPTLGKLVDRLEEKGWVERQIEQSDQRARRLVITNQAYPLIDEMEELAAGVHTDALDGVASDEADRLHDTLMTVKANLVRLLNGDRPSGDGAQKPGC